MTTDLRVDVPAVLTVTRRRGYSARSLQTCAEYSRHDCVSCVNPKSQTPSETQAEKRTNRQTDEKTNGQTLGIEFGAF